MSLLDRYFLSPLDPAQSLQKQVHDRMVEAILDGGVPPHDPLPATRDLADRIGVSRNTVVLVYERLTEEGYLAPVKRRGYFIDQQFLRQQLNMRVAGYMASEPREDGPVKAVDWSDRMLSRPSLHRNVVKPKNWQEFSYPFIYGQVAIDKVSIARWRDATRLASSAFHAPSWVLDLVDGDDPMLVEQIINRVLPQRGLKAKPEEILITTGSQNGLYLAGNLLCGPGTRVALENPGYVDTRNILRDAGADLVPIPVDANGMVVDDRLRGCELVYVTPSHQSPTSVTMSLQRRLALLDMAERQDALILEDDYEHELNFVGPQRAAVRSFDNADRTIYLGSLSKTVFPGLRLGFVLAAEPLIRELRALRRLMYRHTSAHDQRAMAIFIAEGHLDAHIRRVREQLGRKWATMQREIVSLLPDCEFTQTTGGSAIWLRLPWGIDCWDVQRAALKRSVLVEPGDIQFIDDQPPRNIIRLGYAAIAQEAIVPGLMQLREAINEVRRESVAA
ncbi:PLP-dependent aminotransferase family protein [Oleomonas cavernae]|uniref:PLP-dependent aminotransferase family protein n=1 Tax=Oleomonas cavernae TaxID=2320859 RepID=A0A418WTW9_9PROT|nr:PLP-dependent aminotransferase family protein [Oleomonas cavernae]RJF94647.1 PLP-dependent aminotransferase family protein [Oleomonas cavernae]